MIDWIVAAWNWIVANMTNLKDFLWIVFTFIATLVAILTYRRARHTLLQPLRTEVIKRQTDLLVNLLDYFDESVLYSFKLDYCNIVSFNVIKLLERYGINFSDDTILKEIEEERAGAIFDKNIFLQSSDSKAESENQYKVNKVNLNNDKVEEVFFTKQHFMCKRELVNYANNPFMPKKIKKLLNEIESDINDNLSMLMKLLNEFYTKINSEQILDEGFLVNEVCSAVYNEFNTRSKKHDEKIKKIKELIGQYLMVDKKW